MDRSPAEVVATLLMDEEVYLCTANARCIVFWPPRCRFRNAGRSDPEYKKRVDGHGAERSWDITRLLGPKKWSYYYLYVIMDVVGWMVADRENSALAGRLIRRAA